MADGDSNFQRLVDAGVIANPSAFEEADRDVINSDLTEDQVRALIDIKAKLFGPGPLKLGDPKAIAF